jgi:curved DNA-binding protein CbpA
MSFQINRGLFLLDFIDHHAILGVSVDAEIKDIRKRYLKVARRLHPDSSTSEQDDERQQASQFLSRLVNPAWEKLSQERDRSEYAIILKLKGQQGVRQQSTLEIHSSLAKQLSTANNPDHFYHASLKGLAEKLYDHLDQTLELIAQISELNLVYLMRKEEKGELNLNTPRNPSIYTGSNIPDSSQSSTMPAANSAPPPPPRHSMSEQNYRRAEAYIVKNNFAQAILELRDALQMEPRNSRCHSLMGLVYLKQKQATMAKIHFNKALEIDPKDAMALEGKKMLEQMQNTTAPGSTAGTKAMPPKTPPKPNKSDGKSGGGLFGLFGGKKK